MNILNKKLPELKEELISMRNVIKAEEERNKPKPQPQQPQRPQQPQQPPSNNNNQNQPQPPKKP